MNKPARAPKTKCLELTPNAFNPNGLDPALTMIAIESELGHLFPGVHRVNIEVPTRIGDDQTCG